MNITGPGARGENMRKQILVALAIVLAPAAALAQESENTDDVTFDEYSAAIARS